MSLPSDLLRPITDADHAAVLDWNERNVELLAPLAEERLLQLLAWSRHAMVVVQDGLDVGFVLTFGAGSAYDSTNYRWFSERNTDFVYLDRIVIEGSARRTGLGTRVYDALEADARQVAAVLCLEVNLDPPNQPSLAFHQSRGYREVGQDEANGHVVSLMEKLLSAPVG